MIEVIENKDNPKSVIIVGKGVNYQETLFGEITSVYFQNKEITIGDLVSPYKVKKIEKDEEGGGFRIECY